MSYSPRIILWLFASAVLTAIPAAAFGQESGGGMRMTTSGNGSLDILLEPIWGEDAKVSLNIMFLNPGTEERHQHQDYDVVIRQDGNQIFSAAGALNQQLLHNVPGNVTIPYKFEQNGNYTVEVQVLGLGLPPIPIAPETATFPIQVTPEFPTGMVLAVTAAIAGSIALTRKFKLF